MSRVPPARASVRLAWLVLYGVAGLLLARCATAATPEALSLSPSSPTTTWSVPLLVGTNPTDRSHCVEDVSCDTVRVVLAAGDWRGKQVQVSLDWLVPANDFDLYVFRDQFDGQVAGQSTSGAPGTHEGVTLTIDAVLGAPRVYIAHVVASLGAGTATGKLQVAPISPGRTATHVLDPSLTFCANTTVLAPFAVTDCEPSVRVDTHGNAYVSAIRGVPAGVDLWRFDLDATSPTFDPELRHPVYLGQPDAFSPQDSTGGRDGGGDVDIATSFPSNPGTTPEVTIVSLAAADISSAVSSDRGQHFTLSPAVAAVPADDRQWIEAAGDDTVYAMYRGPIPGTSLFAMRSTDHGVTYPLSSLVSASGTTPGYIDVDHATGEIYIGHMSSNALMVSHSADRGLTWTTSTADNGTSHGHLFDVVKVDDAGTVYALWSDDHAVWLTHSFDHAQTWAPPVQVSSTESHLAVFPWMEAGSAGRVVVVWFGTSSDVNSDAADWHLYAAITTQATATQPMFHLAEVSDHVVHASNISEGGLGLPIVSPTPDRNLGDYFQVAIDPQGAAIVSWGDDHNDFEGHTYVAHQLSGPSLYASANGGTGVLDPIAPTPLPQPDPSQPQVSDFLHDAATGAGLQPLPDDNAYDILSIRYGCATQGAAALLETRMAVSKLAPVPPNSTWRVNFAANAPGSIADRGDQFFVLASSGADPRSPTYQFGSAIRDSSGAFVYTVLGSATSGAMDTTTNEVVVRLNVGALDPYVTHGPPIRPGSVLVGLRGSTGTSAVNGARDITRGGGSYAFCAAQLAVEPLVDADFALGLPRPNPTRDGTDVALTLAREAWTEVGVFDAQGRRTRTLFAGGLAAGSHVLHWDGRSDAGPRATAGIYFLRTIAGGRTRSQRLVIVH